MKTDILQMIRETNGKFFTVEFIKKDGSIRKLTGRLGVKKGVKGVGMAYDPLSKGLLPVYEMANDGFRMINLETILSLTIDGITYNIQ